jgi:hypothetical protein
VTLLNHCCTGANIEVHIQVLTTGYWPSPAACNTLIIPEEVRLVTVTLLMIVSLLVDYCCLCAYCLPHML